MGTKNEAVKELLTDEELAALEDDEGGSDPDSAGDDDDAAGDDAAAAAAKDAAAAKADGDDDDDDPDAADADAGDQAAAAVADPATPAAAAGDAPAADPAPSPDAGEQNAEADDITASVPQATWLLPQDHKGKIEALEANLDELAKKFDDGELTGTEFRQQSRQIERERDDLRFAMERASIKEDAAKDGWYEACDSFLAQNAAFAKEGPLRNMLDSEVRRIQETLGAQGKNYMHPSVLQRAADNVRKSAAELLGVQIEVKDVNGKPTTPAAKQEAPKAKPRAADPVPTLSNVPVAGDETIDGGEFAYLDRLANSNPIEFEKELAKMQAKDPEKAEKYLAYIN